MFRLDANEYSCVAGLSAGLESHLNVPALLQGSIPGHVFVDDPRTPRAALIITGGRYLLAGDPNSVGFARDLKQYFDEAVFPHGEAGDGFNLFFSEGWEQAIEGTILAGRKIYPRGWQYYEMRSMRTDWRKMMPEGFELVEVNQALLERTDIQGLDELREEMMSERPTVEDFLAKSFGYSLVHQNKLITWCLSEYNVGDRCEVGIATAEDFRRRGLATLSGIAFAERALAKGYTRIGWHCLAKNQGSVNTALKIGFEKVEDYASYGVPFDE